MKSILATPRLAAAAVSAMMVLSAGILMGDDYWTPKGLPGTDAGRVRTLDEIEPREVIDRLPYSIDASGAYYVTTNLAGMTRADGIVVNASDVRIDLGGSTLYGVAGSRSGIQVHGVQINIKIFNGIIRGWGEYGINATNASECVLFELQVYTNGFAGICAGDNSQLRKCSAVGNGYLAINTTELDDGIYTRPFCSITECKSWFNFGCGFYVEGASRVTECTSVSNGDDGLQVLDYCTIANCMSAVNGYNGIKVWSNCRIEDNTCVENSWNSLIASGIGIVGSGNRIDGNSVSDNYQYGIKVEETGGGNLIIRNSAHGNVNWSYWESPSGDYFGQILGTTELTSGQAGFLAINPWANFDY